MSIIVNIEKLKEITKLIIVFPNKLFFVSLNYPNLLRVNMSNCEKIIEGDALRHFTNCRDVILTDHRDLKGIYPFGLLE